VYVCVRIERGGVRRERFGGRGGRGRGAGAQYPKKNRKSSRYEPFEAEHPKRYQNRFFNP